MMIQNCFVCLGIYILNILFACCNSCAVSNDKISNNSSKSYNIPERNITIDKDIDLKGGTLILNDSSELCFKKGAIKNGIIVGHNTKIKGTFPKFENIEIKGSWLVQNISTEMFTGQSNEEKLFNALAINNPNLQTTIKIKKGIYKLVATKDHPYGIRIVSNTNLIIDGQLNMLPNNLEHYATVLIENAQNIIISGRGNIKGDLENHLGNTGEWGMGIKLIDCDKIILQELKVEENWGDCVYIGKGCKDVCVKNCHLSKARRQGISVIAGNNVIIRNCLITDIKGTAPEYAIDIEPNSRDVVENVIIDNVRVLRCQGGIEAHGRDGDTHVRNVFFRNCNVTCRKKYPIRLYRCDNANVENCTVNYGGIATAIYCYRVANVKLSNNKSSKRMKPYQFDECITSYIQ